MTEDPDVDAGSSLEGAVELGSTTLDGITPVGATPEEAAGSELGSEGLRMDDGSSPVGPTFGIADERPIEGDIVDGIAPVGPTINGMGRLLSALDEDGSELEGLSAPEDGVGRTTLCGTRPFEGPAELSGELELAGTIDDGSSPVGTIWGASELSTGMGGGGI